MEWSVVRRLLPRQPTINHTWTMSSAMIFNEKSTATQVGKAYAEHVKGKTGK